MSEKEPTKDSGTMTGAINRLQTKQQSLLGSQLKHTNDIIDSLNSIIIPSSRENSMHLHKLNTEQLKIQWKTDILKHMCKEPF